MLKLYILKYIKLYILQIRYDAIEIKFTYFGSILYLVDANKGPATV